MSTTFNIEPTITATTTGEMEVTVGEGVPSDGETGMEETTTTTKETPTTKDIPATTEETRTLNEDTRGAEQEANTPTINQRDLQGTSTTPEGEVEQPTGIFREGLTVAESREQGNEHKGSRG